MKTTIQERSKRIVNLEYYNSVNTPELVSEINVNPPAERQYILRMLVKRMFGEFQLPENLEWCRPLIESAEQRQKEMGINQPFCYVTIRSGQVTSMTDDEWHVDGFSMNITHIPEQNYIWVDKHTTECVSKSIKIPEDFDHAKHNIHYFLSDNITENDEVETLREKTLYCMDPYVIHRRPDIPTEINRCFVRISFTPIEIEDCNNTQNPLLETNYKRDGVKDFRGKLTRY